MLLEGKIRMLLITSIHTPLVCQSLSTVRLSLYTMVSGLGVGSMEITSSSRSPWKTCSYPKALSISLAVSLPAGKVDVAAISVWGGHICLYLVLSLLNGSLGWFAVKW